MITPIICLNGFAGSGKSTFANFLIEEYGFQRVKFADTLKNMVRKLLSDAGVPRNRIEKIVEGTTAEKAEPIPELQGVSGRHIMMTLGSEWRDLIFPTLWTHITDRKLERMIDSYDCKGIIIDDLRFPHEIEHMTSKYTGRNSCDLWFAKIKGKDYEDIVANAETAHQSEKPLSDDHFSFIIENDGTLGELRDKALDVMHQIDENMMMKETA